MASVSWDFGWLLGYDGNRILGFWLVVGFKMESVSSDFVWFGFKTASVTCDFAGKTFCNKFNNTPLALVFSTLVFIALLFHICVWLLGFFVPDVVSFSGFAVHFGCFFLGTAVGKRFDITICYTILNNHPQRSRQIHLKLFPQHNPLRRLGHHLQHHWQRHLPYLPRRPPLRLPCLPQCHLQRHLQRVLNIVCNSIHNSIRPAFC